MFKRFFYLIYLFISLINFRYFSKFIDNNFSKIRVILLKLSGAKIGKNSKIYSGVIVINPQFLTIGENTNIGFNTKIYNYSQVLIGDNVDIGPELYINTSNHTFSNINKPIAYQNRITKDIIIKSNIWIGARVTIILGAKINKDIVIGASSLVNKNLESGYIYAGVPAKKIKKLFMD